MVTTKNDSADLATRGNFAHPGRPMAAPSQSSAITSYCFFGRELIGWIDASSASFAQDLTLRGFYHRSPLIHARPARSECSNASRRQNAVCRHSDFLAAHFPGPLRKRKQKQFGIWG